MDFEVHGKVAIGVFYLYDGAIIIDSGIDENEIRKIINNLNSNGIRILGLLLTHYHADHSGGAFFARKRHINVYGESETKYILQSPDSAHLYFTGFYSKDFIKSKFITPMATDIDTIDSFPYKNEISIINLPGHTMNHIGFKIQDVIFAGDAVFSSENLEKHPIPYFADYQNFRATLENLLSFSDHKIICSHGGLLVNPRKTILENIERLDEIHDLIDDLRKRDNSLSAVIKEVLLHYNIKRDHISYSLDSSSIRSMTFSIYKLEYSEGDLRILDKK